MSSPAAKSPYAGYRFPAEVISQAVWLYFRFPLSLRMVEEMLAARGVVVSHETVRRWALKFGQGFADRIRRRLPHAGDKWHLDEVAIKIAGVQHWLWRAVDQTGMVLDVLVQRRRGKRRDWCWAWGGGPGGKGGRRDACGASRGRGKAGRRAGWPPTSSPVRGGRRRRVGGGSSTAGTRVSTTGRRTPISRRGD